MLLNAVMHTFAHCDNVCILVAPASALTFHGERIQPASTYREPQQDPGQQSTLAWLCALRRASHSAEHP